MWFDQYCIQGLRVPQLIKAAVAPLRIWTGHLYLSSAGKKSKDLDLLNWVRLTSEGQSYFPFLFINRKSRQTGHYGETWKHPIPLTACAKRAIEASSARSFRFSAPFRPRISFPATSFYVNQCQAQTTFNQWMDEKERATCWSTKRGRGIPDSIPGRSRLTRKCYVRFFWDGCDTTTMRAPYVL